MNRLIEQARAFSHDRPTHTRDVAHASLVLKGRRRAAAAEVFRPRSSREAGLPLALIPGGASTPSANFFALGPALMAREPDRTFIFLHTPGTGLSGRRVWDLGHLDFTRLYLAALAAATGGRACILGGHSQGGGYAQTAACANGGAPARERLDIAALLLLDPIPLGGAAEIVRRFAVFGWPVRRLARGILMSPDASDEAVGFLRWGLREERAISPLATWANIRGRDFPDPAHPFTGPVLIVGADASGAIDQRRLRAMAGSATYPRAEYVAVESRPGEIAGHLNYLAYARTLDRIAEFLCRCDYLSPALVRADRACNSSR